MFLAIFLTVLRHAEIQFRIRDLGAATFLAAVKCGFLRGLASLKAFPATCRLLELGLATDCWNSRPKQIVREAKKEITQVRRLCEDPEQQWNRDEYRQPPDLHREEQKQQELDFWKQGRKREKGGNVDEESTAGHGLRVNDVGNQEANEAGIVKQAGAEDSPSALQRIAHHESDHDHEEQEQGSQHAKSARAAAGKQKCEQPPDFTRENLTAVEFKNLPDIGVHDL